MIREIDPTATLGAARIRDEPWEAGRGELQEPATSLYANLGPLVDAVRGKKHDATLVTPPPDMGPDSMPRPPTSSPVLPRERSSFRLFSLRRRRAVGQPGQSRRRAVCRPGHSCRHRGSVSSPRQGRAIGSSSSSVSSR